MLSSKTAVTQDTGEPPRNSSASQESPWTLVSVFSLVLSTAAAAALRFLFLARKPFWFDESFSAVVARLSWHDFLRLLWWREANMSLYYLLLRAWLHLDGFSPFFIRSLSVMASLATLPAIFWLGSELFDRRAGLIAVALISCNAYHIRYAQEARSYSLFVLLATLSSAFFVACVREPLSSERNRWNYILASVLAVYTHLYALLLVTAQRLSLPGPQQPQPSGRRVAIADATHRSSIRHSSICHAWIWIGVATLPLLAFVAKTGTGPIRWLPQPRLQDLLVYWEHMAGNDGLSLLLLYAAACLAAILPLREPLSRSSVFRLHADWESWRCQFLLVWLLFPAALALLISLAHTVFLARYFVFCLPALIMLAAAGVANLQKTWMMATCLAVMLLLSLQGTLSYYDHDFDLTRDGSQAAANYILDHAQPGDAILFHSAEARVPFEFFRSLREARDSRTGTVPGPEVIFPRHRDHFDYRDIGGKPNRDLILSVPARYARIWLVLMNNGAPGQPDATTLMLNQTLAGSFQQIQQLRFPQVEVKLYSKP